MIKVYGFVYHNDNDMRDYQHNFENVGQFVKYIMDNTKCKESVRMPAMVGDGVLNKTFAGTFSAHLRYAKPSGADVHVLCIKDDFDGILFSSGERTGGHAHISKSTAEAFRNLEKWASEEYIFVD